MIAPAVDIYALTKELDKLMAHLASSIAALINERGDIYRAQNYIRALDSLRSARTDLNAKGYLE